MSIATQFGDRLPLTQIVTQEVRALMGRYRVSQMDLAAWLALPQSTISNRLNGRTEWRVSEIERVAEGFAVHPASLLGVTTKTPRRDGVGLPIDSVRHQGLEPRTRWSRAEDGVIHLLPRTDTEGAE